MGKAAQHQRVRGPESGGQRRSVREHGRKLVMGPQRLWMFNDMFNIRSIIDITVCSHDSNLELLLPFDLLFVSCPPLNRMHTVIPQPGSHPDQALREIYQILQRPGHRTEYARYALLPGHTRIHAHLRPPPCATSQRIYACEVRWSSY